MDRGLGQCDREAARARRRGRASTATRRARGTRRATPRRRDRAAPAGRRLRPTEPGTRSPIARRARRRRAGYVSLAPHGGHRPHIFEQSDAADDRSRVDRAPVGLVVERDVARDDRNAQRLASLRHSLDRLGELPRDLALLRVAEVETVRQPDRLGAGAGDVARRLEHGERAARPRPEATHAALAVERDGESAVAGPKPQHGGVQPRPAHGARADEVVVAAVDPLPAADVRRAEQLEQRVRVRRRLRRT